MSVHRVSPGFVWWRPYCCTTVNTAFVTLRGTGRRARTFVRLAHLSGYYLPPLRYPSQAYRGATIVRRVAASSPSPPLLAQCSAHRSRSPHATLQRSRNKRPDGRTRTADLLITRELSEVAGICASRTESTACGSAGTTLPHGAAARVEGPDNQGSGISGRYRQPSAARGTEPHRPCGIPLIEGLPLSVTNVTCA